MCVCVCLCVCCVRSRCWDIQSCHGQASCVTKKLVHTQILQRKFLFKTGSTITAQSDSHTANAGKGKQRTINTQSNHFPSGVKPYFDSFYPESQGGRGADGLPPLHVSGFGHDLLQVFLGRGSTGIHLDHLLVHVGPRGGLLPSLGQLLFQVSPGGSQSMLHLVRNTREPKSERQEGVKRMFYFQVSRTPVHCTLIPHFVYNVFKIKLIKVFVLITHYNVEFVLASW